MSKLIGCIGCLIVALLLCALLGAGLRCIRSGLAEVAGKSRAVVVTADSAVEDTTRWLRRIWVRIRDAWRDTEIGSPPPGEPRTVEAGTPIEEGVLTVRWGAPPHALRRSLPGATEDWVEGDYVLHHPDRGITARFYSRDRRPERARLYAVKARAGAVGQLVPGLPAAPKFADLERVLGPGSFARGGGRIARGDIVVYAVCSPSCAISVVNTRVRGR